MNSVRKGMLEAALGYCRRGWSVIPVHEVTGGKCSCGNTDCKNPGKHPRVEWKKHQTSKADESQIRRWWKRWPSAWVGIVTGSISGLAVVDVDGKKGQEALDKAGIELPVTVTVQTGGGGWHYYYRYSGGEVKTKAGLLPQVDFRGDGGFVVAPPSGHVSRGSYHFADGLGPEDVGLASFPPAVAALAYGGQQEKPRLKDTTPVLQGVSEGQRDNELFRYACKLRGQGISREEAEILIKHAAANCIPPFPTQEALAKVESAYKHPTEEEKRLVERPEIVTAAELAAKEIRPTRWLIEGLLPEGLTILAGRSKSGKSFLALQMAMSVALGKDICGFEQLVEEVSLEEFNPWTAVTDNRPKGVLYLDLEMDEQSILQRMNTGISSLSEVKVTKNEGGKPHISGYFQKLPSNLHIAMQWPPISEGFEEHLESFLGENPDVEFVVVDVLKRIRPSVKGNRNAYDVDYETLIPLQNIAKKRGIALLVCHHTRKSMGEDNDPVEMVSGTMGVTAAVDGILVLQRHVDNRATLHVTGRKLMNRELELQHEYPSGLWRLQGDADDIPLSEAEQKIVEILKERAEPISPKEIAEALGENYNSTKTRLNRMIKAEKLIASKGKYELPFRINYKKAETSETLETPETLETR